MEGGETKEQREHVIGLKPGINKIPDEEIEGMVKKMIKDTKRG